MRVLAFLSFFVVNLFFGECSTACMEPKLCQCISGCKVFAEPDTGGGERLPCDDRLLVVPNLGIWWNARQIKGEVTFAKEKLGFEAAKTYDGVWKAHVLDGKKAGVRGMQSLLGVQLNLVKSTYEASIQGRIAGATNVRACNIAKCLAFCADSCESQCEQLESTDETFLAEIDWTKDMCDVESSKALLSQRCKDIKEKSTDCDASCDGSVSDSFSSLIMVLLLGFTLSM